MSNDKNLSRRDFVKTAGGVGLVLGGSPTDDTPHGRINTQAIGVVGVFVTSQTTVDRLSNHPSHAVLRVLAGAGIVNPQLVDFRRQPERFIEFSIGQKTGITGDVRTVEFETDLAVEIDPQGTPFALTHRIPQSMSCLRVSHLLFCRLNTTPGTPALSFYLGNAG